MTVETGFSAADLRSVASLVEAVENTDLIISKVTIRTTDGDKIVIRPEGDEANAYVVSLFSVVTEIRG